MSRQKNRPTKFSVKVPLSPSVRAAYCCLCSDYISDGYDRRHMWQTEDRKSRICTLVEQVLQVNIIKSVHTEFICRTCFTKVKSLNTKIQSTRDEIDTYVQQIGRHGAAMKCMKRDIRERITATDSPMKQRKYFVAAKSPAGQLLGEKTGQPSLPESPSGGGCQQAAFAAAPWMPSGFSGTVLELGSSAQFISSTPCSTNGDFEGSTSSTQCHCRDSIPQQTHSGDDSNNNDHELSETAVGEISAPRFPVAGHHTYCQISASHRDVGTLSDTPNEDAAAVGNEDTKLERERSRTVKAEQSEPLYQEVGVTNGDPVKTEECRPKHVVSEVKCSYDAIKREHAISQYIEDQLCEEKRTKHNGVKGLGRRRQQRLWKCASCRTVCLSRSALAIHDRVHTGVKPYTCSTCGRSFAQTSCLKTHARTHTGERPFVCRTCGKAYAASSELKIHERTHRGEKPYLCATCGKAFVSSSNLRQHETTHVVVRMYACPTCDKTFVCYSHLTRHRKTHTGLRPHTCNVCGRSFVRGHHLTRHIQSLHSSSE